MPVNEQNGIALLAIGEKGEGDETAGAVWDRLMKDATEHCLIAQAYAGTATLAVPAKQREQEVREHILSMHLRNEPEENCDRAFAGIVEEAEASGALQHRHRNGRIAEVVEGEGPGWDALLKKAKQHALLARVAGNHETLPRVFLFATPAAQRAGETGVMQYTFSHLRKNRGRPASPAADPAASPA